MPLSQCAVVLTLVLTSGCSKKQLSSSELESAFTKVVESVISGSDGSADVMVEEFLGHGEPARNHLKREAASPRDDRSYIAFMLLESVGDRRALDEARQQLRAGPLNQGGAVRYVMFCKDVKSLDRLKEIVLGKHGTDVAVKAIHTIDPGAFEKMLPEFLNPSLRLSVQKEAWIIARNAQLLTKQAAERYVASLGSYTSKRVPDDDEFPQKGQFLGLATAQAIGIKSTTVEGPQK